MGFRKNNLSPDEIRRFKIMTFSGLALLPSNEHMDAFIAFQRKAGPSISGPRLGKDHNLPHVSIFQSQLDATRLTNSLLDRIVEDWPTGNRNSVVYGKVGRLYHQPVDWVFSEIGAAYEKSMPSSVAPWCADLQKHAIARLKNIILLSEIDGTKSFSGYSEQERKAYLRYGYRYVGDAFRPHVTLGRVAVPGTKYPAAEVQSLYAKILSGKTITFDRLAFYIAGEFGALEKIIAVKDLVAT